LEKGEQCRWARKVGRMKQKRKKERKIGALRGLEEKRERKW